MFRKLLPVFALAGLLTGCGTVVAPALAPYDGTGTPVPEAKALGMCPTPPDWASVVAAPASYRARCVYVAGFIYQRPAIGATEFQLSIDHSMLASAVQDDQSLASYHHYQMDYARYGDPAQQNGTLLIDFVSSEKEFWQAVALEKPVAVIGTIEGAKDGMPWIGAAYVWVRMGS